MGEPLKSKYYIDVNNNRKFAYHIDIKSAVEWYKYFKDDVNLLIEEFPEYKVKLLKEDIGYEEDGNVWVYDSEKYKDWLLDQAFPDLNTKNSKGVKK